MFVSKAKHLAALERNTSLAKQLVSETTRANQAMEQVRWLRSQLSASFLTLFPAAAGSTTQAQSAPVQPKPVDRVAAAIRNVAGNDGRLRAHLWHYAEGQRAAKIEEEAIVQSILQWQDADDDAENDGDGVDIG